MFRWAIWAGAAFLMLCQTGIVDAFSRTNRLPAVAAEYRQTLPPVGLISYCARSPNDCRIERSGTSRVDLTAEGMAELTRINDAVNAQIAPIADIDLYGEPEYWAIPTDAGDCEDVLLLKRRMLSAAGFPRQSLRITVVLDEAGAGHAVLTVTTRQGDYILDNRRHAIVLWHETGYKFLKRQSPRDPRVWVSLVQDEIGTKRSLSVASDQK